FGSRTWKISVSTIFFGSRLKEYCTVENQACAENSRRIRTQSAIPESDESCALAPGLRKSGCSSSVERPRSTSKSGLKSGCFGIRESAEAISCCSAGEGEHTFNTFTLTCGCEDCWALANCA